ncbi:MAG: immunoglobulin domain-containing protein [Verrucomicrobiota bacterium]
MITIKQILSSMALLAATIGIGLSAQAQQVGLWQFDGNYNSANGGDPITEFFAKGTFGTTTSFGIGDINGEEAQVLKFPEITEADTGFTLPVFNNMADPNTYTIMFDVYYPLASNSSERGLADLNPDYAGPELLVGGNNTVVGVNGGGEVQPDTWHRIIFTIDHSSQLVSGYLDGKPTATWSIPGDLVDFGPQTIDSQLDVLLFGPTKEGYVNSIQLREGAISAGQAFALGTPTAAGIPETLPDVPSYIVNWLPSGNVASRSTDVGITLNQGSTSIDQDSIVLTLDGEVQSPSISKSGDDFIVLVDRDQPFAPGSKHTLTITYSDDKAGEQTAEHAFDAAIYYEDFESVVLGPNEDESLESDTAWSRKGPEGWGDVDDSGVPGAGDDETDGVTEWAGWSFADKDWWIEAAGDQRRSEFVLATGTVMVADPDEWDDQPHADSAENGWYETYVTTPEISLAGVAPRSAYIQFASSWRPEFDSNYRQSGNIVATYSNGDSVEILRWVSDPASPNYHDHAPNETIIIQLDNPAGVDSVSLKFGMFDAGNDWWWAIDNLVLNAGAAPPTLVSSPAPTEVTEGSEATFSVTVDGSGPFTYEWFFKGESIATSSSNENTDTLTISNAKAANVGNYSVVVSNAGGSTPESSSALLEVKEAIPGSLIFFEGFEGLPLGANVDEGVAGDEVWTDTLPSGWDRVNDLPGLDDDEVGVREWEGWTFANREWWANTAGDQRRTEFTKGTGTVAIADGDEWDDKGSPSGLGTMDTKIITPAISIAEVEQGTLVLRFNSSWRPEVIQTGLIEASFDGAEPVQIAEFRSESNDPNYKDHAPNDTVTIAIDAPAGASTMSLSFRYYDAGNNWWWAIDNIEVYGVLPQAPSFASQDFEGLTLGSSVNEEVAADNVWTKTAPEGWSIDDSGVPGVGNDATDGVTEWAGWSFADKDWWAQTAGDQRRSEFTKASGTIAIADGDEWDDQPHAEGFMDTFMSWTVDVSSASARSLALYFDSSWRPEYDSNYHQTANVTVSYDGGEPVQVMLWESNEDSPYYKPNATNDSVMVPLGNPEGAKSMVVTFGYFDAGNDWWWAIDNVRIEEGAYQHVLEPGVYGFENFERLTLGSSVNEEVAADDVWTKSTPYNMSIDDSGVAGVGNDDTDGVTEWAGWSFANKDWWVQTAGDQRRSEFVNGVGTVAIADGDEWDDQPHAEGYVNTFLSWDVNITGATAGALQLQFDSSWRPEYDSNYHQTANIMASYDGADPVQVMLWESNSDSPNFKDHTPNENVILSLDNPAGAKNVTLTFGYFDAGNDWWWAIDNLIVHEAIPSSISIAADGGQVTITYEGSVLETAGSISGPWTPVDSATSPYTVPADQGQAYFRSR